MAMLSPGSMDFFGGTCVQEYVDTQLSLVRNNPRIWYPFLRWSTLDKSAAFSAVSANTLPYVDFMSPNKHDAGSFSFLSPDTIGFNYEDAKKVKLEENYVMRHMALKEMEATILHELVHWGRFKNKNRIEKMETTYEPRYWNNSGKFVETSYGKIDTGTRFEMEAFQNSYYDVSAMPTSTQVDTYE